jgi:hypothetical protein
LIINTAANAKAVEGHRSPGRYRAVRKAIVKREASWR